MAFTDPENEHLIQAAINDLVKDKTLIMVAHRLGTVIDADSILVIENGILSAQGKHEELLKNSLLYQTLWKNYADVREGGITE